MFCSLKYIYYHREECEHSSITADTAAVHAHGKSLNHIMYTVAVHAHGKYTVAVHAHV